MRLQELFEESAHSLAQKDNPHEKYQLRPPSSDPTHFLYGPMRRPDITERVRIDLRSSHNGR